MLPLTVPLSFWSSWSLQGLATVSTRLSFQSPITTSSPTYPKFALVPLTAAPATPPSPAAPAEFPGLGCFLVGSGGGRTCACSCVGLPFTSNCSRELPLRRLLSCRRKQLVAGVERRGLCGNSLPALQCLS